MFTQSQNVIAIFISCVLFLAENDNFFPLRENIGILGCYFHDTAYCRVFFRDLLVKGKEDDYHKYVLHCH